MTSLVWLIILVIALVAWLVMKGVTWNWISQSERPERPQVVVNVPADFKPMASLPPTQIEGARAQLWYSVYLKASNNGVWNDDGIEAANAAVEACFPS